MNSPPKCKLIFRLIREDGLKYADVAALLNISIKTVEAQMAIAVKGSATATILSRISPNSTTCSL